MLEQLLVFFSSCSSIQFLIHSPFTNSQLGGYYWHVTTHCAATVSLTRCHTVPVITRNFPTSFPGRQHAKHVPMLTYIIYLQPNYSNICNNSLYMSKSFDLLLVVKSLAMLEEQSNQQSQKVLP